MIYRKACRALLLSDPGALLLLINTRIPDRNTHVWLAPGGGIETGETCEDCVRREVHEESGIRVGDVRYVKSQPWPFPSSLMIGCIGEGTTDEITVDFGELEDVKWFSLETIRAALDGQSSELFVPPPFAVAHHLVRAWAQQRAGTE